MSLTDFNDMITAHGKPRAFELIKQIIDASLLQKNTGSITVDVGGALTDDIVKKIIIPAIRDGIDNHRTVLIADPPDIESPPPEAYTADPVANAGTKNAPEAAQAREWGGDDSWRNLLLSKNGSLIDCRENVFTMLCHHPAWAGVLWADEFSRKIVKRQPAPWETPANFTPDAEWKDDDDLRLGMWLAQHEKLVVRNERNLTAAIGWCAREHKFHPVIEHLESFTWDRISRIDDWVTDFLGVKKTEYSVLVGRFFLIGMVARIYLPGCSMRFMPILEGGQYRGKSSALRILGGPWFGDTSLDLNNKDSYQLIQGKWLYEIGELDAFNKAESTRIKAFVSSQVDTFRAPYDRAPRDWPRQIVFGGTTNQDEYFKDTTGNTRYWPLRVEEVEPINLEGLAQVRDQLLAEARYLFEAGERWHPLRDEQLRLFEPEQEAREISDPWQSGIATWLESTTRERITVLDVLSEGLKIEIGKIDGAKQMSTRVGVAMRRLGWTKKRETTGNREYYYVRPAGASPAVKTGEADDDMPF